MKTAVIAGATGLVGGELLKQILLDDRYQSVVTLTRRQFSVSHPKLQKIITDFAQVENAIAGTQPNDVYCCLGTTMASAGSREKFHEVDFEYPLALARATRALGASKYLLVSALGASRRSLVYYNRVKGEVEEAIRAVHFPSLHIFRPSLLLGHRTEKRVGEDAAKTLYRTFGFLIPRKYKAIEAGTVARAMLASASENTPGVFIHESDEMQVYR